MIQVKTRIFHLYDNLPHIQKDKKKISIITELFDKKSVIELHEKPCWPCYPMKSHQLGCLMKDHWLYQTTWLVIIHQVDD